MWRQEHYTKKTYIKERLDHKTHKTPSLLVQREAEATKFFIFFFKKKQTNKQTNLLQFFLVLSLASILLKSLCPHPMLLCISYIV